MACARGNLRLSPARDLELSQNNHLTVFSSLFSEFFVKRDIFILTSNSSTEPTRTMMANSLDKNRKPQLLQSCFKAASKLRLRVCSWFRKSNKRTSARVARVITRIEPISASLKKKKHTTHSLAISPWRILLLFCTTRKR